MICSLSAFGKWFSRFFSFYIGLFLILCTSRFADFARGKWSNHDSKNCSEIKTVTWSVIWLWKLKFSIFVCLFVYLFVCTSRFANFAKGKWSNQNSKNCSEIRAVTPFWIWLWNFQFETFIFFTALCRLRTSLLHVRGHSNKMSCRVFRLFVMVKGIWLRQTMHLRAFTKY